jgi:hypothetical protein
VKLTDRDVKLTEDDRIAIASFQPEFLQSCLATTLAIYEE